MHRRLPNLVQQPLRLAHRRQNLNVLPRRLPYSTGPGTARTRTATVLAVIGLSVGAGYIFGVYGPKLTSLTSSSITTASTSKFGSAKEFETALSELKAALEASQLSTDQDVLVAHGTSLNHHHPSSVHSVVVYPRSTEDVVKIVNISRKWRIPITPYSGGTSLEGHTSGVRFLRFQEREQQYHLYLPSPIGCRYWHLR